MSITVTLDLGKLASRMMVMPRRITLYRQLMLNKVTLPAGTSELQEIDQLLYVSFPENLASKACKVWLEVIIVGKNLKYQVFGSTYYDGNIVLIEDQIADTASLHRRAHPWIDITDILEDNHFMDIKLKIANYDTNYDSVLSKSSCFRIWVDWGDM